MPSLRFRSLLLLLTVLSVPVLAAESASYDVSYLWSRDLAVIRVYREKVAQVLGSAMGDRLMVVTDNGFFGLIYHRNGDSAGAGRISKVHSRLLRREGLEASAPIRARDWVVVGDEIPPEIQEHAQTADVRGAAPAQPAAASAETRHQGPEKQELAKQELEKEEVTKEEVTKEEPPDPEPAPVQTSAPRPSDLEKAVENYIKRLRRHRRIAPDERTGWSVYDFTTGQKLVTINEDVPFQAASLIKPFIAAAFFHRVNKGELIYGPRSRHRMRAMIQHSSNASADWVMRRVGGPSAVQRILQRNYGSIFRQTSIVEYIPLNGRTYRNKASVHDYSRFLYALWKGSIPGAEEIKRLMALPGPDRIVTGVEEIPLGTHVYDKTGSTGRLCGDMGILSVVGADGKRYPYTLIGVIEKPDGAGNYTAWIRSRSEVIRDVSGIVYRGILDYHGQG